MDAFVRRYIHENLVYRSVMLPDGAAAYAVGAAIKKRQLGLWSPAPQPRTATMASSFRHLLDFLQKRMRMSTVCTRHQSSRARLVRVSLGFLKIGRGHLVNGDIFPPFPSFPISPSPGSRGGECRECGECFGGDPSETCHLVGLAAQLDRQRATLG